MIVTPVIVEMLALPPDEIDPDRPLAELGIDSVTAAELSAAIEERLDFIIPMERFLGEETLAALEREVGDARAPGLR